MHQTVETTCIATYINYEICATTNFGPREVTITTTLKWASVLDDSIMTHAFQDIRILRAFCKIVQLKNNDGEITGKIRKYTEVKHTSHDLMGGNYDPILSLDAFLKTN